MKILQELWHLCCLHALHTDRGCADHTDRDMTFILKAALPFPTFKFLVLSLAIFLLKVIEYPSITENDVIPALQSNTRRFRECEIMLQTISYIHDISGEPQRTFHLTNIH